MHPQSTSLSELWRPLLGYEDLYAVSNLGRIRREKPTRGTIVGHILRGTPNPGGYFYVSLYRDRHRFAIGVHQIVAAAFLGPCPAGYQVNHRDGNKANNAVSNLEYVTPSENQYHSSRTGLMRTGDRHPARLNPERFPHKLTPAAVREMRALHAQGGWTWERLAARFGVTHNAAYSVVKRLTWRHVP